MEKERKRFLIFFGLALCILISPVYGQRMSDADSIRLIADTVKQIDAAKTVLRTAADVKSGTSQDVLASFFKLAFKDLKDGHHFSFNSSLLAIRAKSDPSVLIDKNYKKLVFPRNFEVGIDLGIDSSFKFKTTALNFKYAIINNRDKDIFTFKPGQEFLKVMEKQAELFKEALEIYLRYEKSSSVSFIKAREFCYPLKNKPQVQMSELPRAFRFILDSLKNDGEYTELSGVKTEDLTTNISGLYKKLSDLMSQRSLWTISSQLQTDWKSAISKADFNSEYLKGMTNNGSIMGLELDIKANLSIYDSTVVSNVYHRKVFSSSAGINWIIYRSPKTQKSYVEFKPALTYNNVLSGQYTGETKSRFTGDGVLRIRITDELWLPFDIKYDPDKKRFFGFLNVTSNFDWLGGKSKSAN